MIEHCLFCVVLYCLLFALYVAMHGIVLFCYM